MRALIAAVCLLFAGAAAKAEKLELTVSEKAGIRRFGYPVYVKLDLGRAVSDKDRYRLLADGKPVAAQFRSLATIDEKNAVALDFNLSIGPLEKKTFTVEYGPKVQAGPEPKGLTLDDKKDRYFLSSGGMTYVVPDELVGFERSLLRIEDPDFVATSGTAYHAIVKFNGRSDSRVSGMVFEVTDNELARADEYEPDGYTRMTAMLASGKRAWVYADARA